MNSYREEEEEDWQRSRVGRSQVANKTRLSHIAIGLSKNKQGDTLLSINYLLLNINPHSRAYSQQLLIFTLLFSFDFLKNSHMSGPGGTSGG